MSYLQIDNFNGSINIICKDDGSGEPLIFASLEDAENSLQKNCQDGIIVPFADCVDLLKRINSLFDSGKLIIEEETAEDRKDFIQIRNEIMELLDIN